MSKKRDPRLYLLDILESGKAIMEYIAGMSMENLKKDRKTYSAIIREFEIIGEAVSKLPKDLKNRYPEVPWRDIKDFRNILTHEYFSIDVEILWRVIKEDLPDLISTVKKILEEFNQHD